MPWWKYLLICVVMKTDGRALNHATLTELRKRGVAAVQSGESPTQVAAALGVNLRSLFRWLALYRRGGWDQLDARKRGAGAIQLRLVCDLPSELVHAIRSAPRGQDAGYAPCRARSGLRCRSPRRW
jgi:hypothetical protein